MVLLVLSKRKRQQKRQQKRRKRGETRVSARSSVVKPGFHHLTEALEPAGRDVAAG